MKTKRKSLIEERYEHIKKRHTSLIKMVEERAAKMKTSWVSFLPDDLMFKIFLLLPIKSLLRFTCVCKAWYKLVYSAEFVEAYNAQAEATPIVFRVRGGADKGEIKNLYHVETQIRQSENFSLFPCSEEIKRSKVIHFLEIENENCKLVDLNIGLSGSVVATCNGLILINSVNKVLGTPTISSVDQPVVDGQENLGWLIVMNPMTRKLTWFLPGTLPNGRHKESYGLMFSQTTNVYKVVHLFKDKSGYIACEIFSLRTRLWKAVNGPPSLRFHSLGQAPISTTGALHWLPGPLPDSPISEYIISMGVDDEQFSTTDLPTTMSEYDRLVEMGGFLSLVKNLDKDHIEVWVLKALEGPEWVKQYTICIDFVFVLGYVYGEQHFVPAFALNAKEMVFKREHRLYSYNFELEEFREINMDHGNITAHETIMPHSNNLATWEPLESIC